MLSMTSFTPAVLSTSHRAESRSNSFRVARERYDAIVCRGSDVVEYIVLRQPVVIQLAVECGHELGVRDISVHRDQVADALNIRKLANFLGCLQLLLVQINVASQGHDAVFD